MKSVKELTDEYISLIKSDEDKAREGYNKALDYISTSTAIYHNEHIRFGAIPKLYNEDIIECFKQIAHTTHAILCKMIDRYLNDKEYRNLFPFSKELEELILCNPYYDQKLPIARIDLFLNEEDKTFKFCEFNADGASAMNEVREMDNAFNLDDTYKQFEKRYNISGFELFNSWVEEVEEIYSTFKYKKENPTIAIVDFMESATVEEFKIFKKAFEDKGYKCVIAEISTLKYDNGLYTKDDEKIDIVYRRAVTSEIMEKIDKARNFIKAVKDKQTCIIGSFRTQVIHNKAAYKIMHMNDTLKFLTDDEIKFVKEHIPKTYDLETGNFNKEEVVLNKNNWIIKPSDKYGASGVYAGVDYTNKEYEKLIEDNTDKGYILQEYAKIYKTENYVLEKNGEYRFDMFDNMPGIFIYNGKFKGIYTRVGRQGIICEDAGGIALCSKYIKEK